MKCSHNSNLNICLECFKEKSEPKDIISLDIFDAIEHNFLVDREDAVRELILKKNPDEFFDASEWSDILLEWDAI